ncbi:ATP-binding cassette domain-containing protein [Microbacterium halophytorum]|uniref:ATP-binding cassette domain-containing protein n=1 Tax=Microbacterium halophytorum TaxID=2067568 RepID=UPI000CFAA5C4|nr:ATP-binding cassette domain-containing protein [Microbacterium halophytorum]
MRETAPLLSLDDVSVLHPDADEPSPRNVALEVFPGDVVLLLGPSGCGKSTLALTMNGLIPHSHDAELTGRVAVAGRGTTEVGPGELSRRVGMVFQDPDAQIITGSVLDEVAFALENLRMPADEVLARAERALRAVGLWERRGDDPGRLSGGGRQRLAFACAIAPEPDLLVLDEPTANLDPAGRADVYAAIAAHVERSVRERPHAAEAGSDAHAANRIHPSAGRAVVLIEHDVAAVRSLVTRVIVLDHHGAVVLDGPADLLENSADVLGELGVGAASSSVPGGASGAARDRDGADAPGDDAASGAVAGSGHAPRTGPDDGAGTAAPIARSSATSSADPSRDGTANASAPAVSVRRLRVARGRGAARAELLRDVSFDLPRGAFLAIVGPNGAGKTTLAQAIAGVVPPPAGAVSIARDGAAPLDAGRAGPRQLAAQVGFVFQNPEHQFVAHTVRDELAYGLRHTAPDDRDARVDDMLRRFDLTEHADRHPFRLSGGQKRRLSVGTALIGGADRPGGVLVLDEPTFGQDRARADALLALLDELHRGGTTVIVVTHDPELVARHATHIAAVRDGRLATIGPARDVLPVVREAAFWRGTAAGGAGAREVPAPERASRAPGAERGAHVVERRDRDGGAGDAARDLAARDATALAGAPRDGTGRGTPGTAGGPAPDIGAGPRVGAAAAKRSPLERLDPLALLIAVLPAMIGLIFTRDVLTPALALGAAYAVVLAGAPKTRATAVWLCGVLPVMAAAIAAGFTLWSDPATGLATGLRLTGLLALALIPGLSMEGTAFVRSAVAHLQVPYRIGYAALAAYRFVPRFRGELDVIRAAHRVRGTGRNPISRAFTAVVPLMASAIRHAERVALAMDARAFGAYPTRTERNPPRWRRRDTAAVAVGAAAAAALFTAGALL